MIETVRTAGGHRKVAVAEVLRYAREQDRALVFPEVLGLPPVSARATSGLRRGGTQLASALLMGDEALARQIVFDLLLAKHSASSIFDSVVAAAFREIGDLWACQEADVYQERRACEIASRIFVELRRVQPAPDKNLSAVGGTIEGDHYSLPSSMADIVLRDCGFNPVPLGTSIPIVSLVRAVKALKPTVFWLSVSYIREGMDFLTEFAALSEVCASSQTALVVGGRALTDEFRQRMTYSAYCDTMQHLEAFAKTLRQSSMRGYRPRGGIEVRRTKSQES